MKKNDFIQIKALEMQTILEKAKNTRLEIADLVLDKNMNKLKDLKAIYKKKQDLAKFLTVARQKQLLKQLELKTEGAKK